MAVIDRLEQMKIWALVDHVLMLQCVGRLLYVCTYTVYVYMSIEWDCLHGI